MTDMVPLPFAALKAQAPDALLGLIAQFDHDPRSAKIDLGVGVYRDDAGHTPVMRAVKTAEAMLLASQSTKAYLGAEGDRLYTHLLGELVFGHRLARDGRLTGVQTPGGTGALRLGAELVARDRRQATVWIGTPTWPNHAPIFQEAGLRVRTHRFFDAGTASINFGAMMADLAEAKPGDLLLLHGCCHNPTGVSFTPAQWAEVVRLCADRGLLPFIDLAYQGLGDGLDPDAAPTRQMLDAVPDALVAYSCDKNFGVYRERVGAFWLWSDGPATTRIAHGHILALGRSLWSMPPDHGAAIVRTVLQSTELRGAWQTELEEMRVRLNDLRRALAAAHPALAPIAAQRGLFAMLPLTPDQVARLRETRGIYMAGNGRINIAGLRHDSIGVLIDALTPCLEGNAPS